MKQTNVEIKKLNTVKFFNILRRTPSLSRMELKEHTVLSWGSVSSISQDLLHKGLIVAEKESATTGRPADRLAVSPQSHLSLGIDINSVGLSFNVVNLAGASIHEAFLPLCSNEKEDLLRQLTEQTEEILSQYRNVMGINLSMQGKLNRRSGKSIRTNFFENWKNVPLVSFFEERFGIPTRLYHDPECLLTYHLETDSRLTDAKNGIVIRVDDGIGMAQIMNGVLCEIGEDTSCELGHTVAVPDGLPCACGRRGCLEAYSSMRSMKNACSPAAETAEQFFARLNKGDPQARNAVAQAARYLGIAIANLFTLSSPDFILLDGIVTVQIPDFFDAVRHVTVSQLQADCNLLRSVYRRDAAAIGACMLTVDKRIEEILFEDTQKN